MPLFLINARDKAGATELRAANRQAHLEYANALGHQLKMAGPVLSDDGEAMIGSTFVVEFESLNDAKAWAERDPYAQAGLFEHAEIMPFIWVIGDGPSNG